MPSPARPRNARRPVVGFVGYSGSGKTTLLRAVVASLAEQGRAVGLVKHAHHTFDIDHPGKDSYELRAAGAGQVLVASARRWALVVETPQGGDPELEGCLARLEQEALDLILVEGFKHARMPKIALHRQATGHPPPDLADPDLVAVASDEPLATALPRLPLADPPAVVAFLLERLSGL